MKLDKKEVVLRRIALMEKGRHQVHLQRERRRKRRGADFPEGIRRDGHLHRRHPAARSADRGPRAEGRALRDGVLTANTKARPQTAAPSTRSSARRARTSSSSAGGDTGTDCVGTSMRHGCKSLLQIEILPKPPMDRTADNPWPEWPKVYKMDYGQEEAAAKFGADPRIYVTTVKKFIG